MTGGRDRPVRHLRLILPRRRILIVDPSPTHRQLLELMLDGRHDVDSASDAATGIAVAFSLRPDLILLDVELPDRSGFDVCRALRAARETRWTPIILVTCHGDERAVATGFQTGCTDVIVKPVEPLEFRAKVESWLVVAPFRPDAAR